MPYKDYEQQLAHSRAYYHAHKEHTLEYKRRFWKENKERLSIKKKAHAEKNKEQKRLYMQQYYREHAEELQVYRRAYYAANREKYIAKNRENYQKDPLRQHAYRRTRDARKKNAPINDLTAAQWESIKLAYGHCCVYCRRKMARLTQDHIVPLSKGGNHTVQNVVPACRSCNSRKGNRAPRVPVQPLLFA